MVSAVAVRPSRLEKLLHLKKTKPKKTTKITEKADSETFIHQLTTISLVR